MRNTHGYCTLAFAALAAGGLAACGGGGGGATPVVPSTALVSGVPEPATSPSPSASATPAPLAIAGRVVQLGGPLAAGASSPPAPTDTLVPSVPVGGATVYLTTTAAAAAGGVPTAAIASAATAADGSFSVPYTSAQGASGLALVVVAGTRISATSGVTDRGFTVAHLAVGVSASSVTAYVDTLTADEQSAFAALNAARAGVGLAPLAADTAAQAAARLDVAQRPGMAACEDYAGAASLFPRFGGIGAFKAWQDTAGPSWPAIVSYESPWAEPTARYAGMAALYGAKPCGTGFVAPINYFEAIYAL